MNADSLERRDAQVSVDPDQLLRAISAKLTEATYQLLMGAHSPEQFYIDVEVDGSVHVRYEVIYVEVADSNVRSAILGRVADQRDKMLCVVIDVNGFDYDTLVPRQATFLCEDVDDYRKAVKAG